MTLIVATSVITLVSATTSTSPKEVVALTRLGSKIKYVVH